jgi:hypothetical protein
MNCAPFTMVWRLRLAVDSMEESCEGVTLPFLDEWCIYNELVLCRLTE